MKRRNKKEDIEQGKARADLIRSIADEAGRFTIRGVAEKALRLHLFGNYDEVRDFDLRHTCLVGAKVQVKRVLKSTLDMSGCPAYVALESGPEAIWRRWADCTRKESRAALEVRWKAIGKSRKVFEKERARHEARFRETTKLTKDGVEFE